MESDLIGCLVENWGVDVESMRYAAVGFGSYHWEVTDAAGSRYFVTVDDLDHKGWLGLDRDSTFDGLGRAFDTALALRRDADLEFVVAPIPAARGGTIRRLGARHTVALFPLVDGRTCGRFGWEDSPEERVHVVRMLAELHRNTRVAQPFAQLRHLDLPYRPRLEAALRELDRVWTGGPLSEPTRDLLARHASELQRLLEAFDRLAGRVALGGDDFVITHGEPHAGNVMRTVDKVLLVDWDTVGFAPPERDLWLFADDLALYADAGGRKIDITAIALYRLRWELDDIATFTSQFRSAHALTTDTEKAWFSLVDRVQRATA
jgi:spectinomycin phosphotransferase